MYQVKFAPDAEADLARLSKPVAQRVLQKLRWLAENFDVLTPEPLTGEWQGVFKLRVGDYRALYTFDRAEQSITVHFVKHRREVYKTR
jgi:mRNA interferase RelE/StbE